MQGVYFILNEGCYKAVMSAFRVLGIENYIWHISYSDVFLRGGNAEHDERLMESGILSGRELDEIIEKDNYLIFEMALMAFPVGTEIAELKTITEFLQSDCQHLLLAWDTAYFVIYSKDDDFIFKLYDLWKCDSRFSELELVDENYTDRFLA